MKKLFVIFLCLLAAFVIVSCKAEPEEEEKSEPVLVPAASDDILSGTAFYRLTATREAKRFALQYLDEEEGTFDPKEGDVLTLKYRTNHAVDRIYLRSSSTQAYFPDSSGYHDIAATGDTYVSGPDEDGWYTFTFTFGEMVTPLFGFRLELASYSHKKFTSGKYIDIKDLMFKGERLIVEEAGEDEEWQSNNGVWNATNTDHTRPTLAMYHL